MQSSDRSLLASDQACHYLFVFAGSFAASIPCRADVAIGEGFATLDEEHEIASRKQPLASIHHTRVLRRLLHIPRFKVRPDRGCNRRIDISEQLEMLPPCIVEAPTGALWFAFGIET